MKETESMCQGMLNSTRGFIDEVVDEVVDVDVADVDVDNEILQARNKAADRRENVNNFEEEAASNNASGANEAIESGSDGAPTEVEDDEPVNRYRVGEEEESDNQSLEGTAAEVRRSGRIRERPKPYWVSEGQKNLLGAAINNEPSTYTEAMKLPDAVKWKQAADSEINSMEVNNVWDLVKRPDKVKTIGSRGYSRERPMTMEL